MIPIVELIRLETSQEGTFGVLRIQKQIFCNTLEPPDRQNAPDISSIPAGAYVCHRVESDHFGETFEVIDVFGRSLIRFHPGNWVYQTEGCILLGESTGKLRGRKGESRAILNSGSTFRAFMDLMFQDEWFRLTIVEYY